MSVLAQAFSIFTTSAIFGFATNWKISLFTMLFMPIIVLGTIFSNKVSQSQLEGDKGVTEKASKLAVEAITNVRTVASLHQENYFINKYAVFLESNLRYVKSLFYND